MLARSFVLSCLAAWAFGCAEGKSGLVLGPEDSNAGSGGETALGGAANEDGAGGSNDATAGGAGGGSVLEPWWQESCLPSVTFENLDSSDTGTSVASALGELETLVHGATQTVCRILYRSADEIPSVPDIQLVLDPSDAPGAVSGTTVRLGTQYLAGFGANDAIEREATGMLLFFVSHLYQHSVDQTPSWLVSGKADYIRLAAGYIDPSGRSAGGSWTDGFRTSAFFLEYVEENHPDFVYAINAKMTPDDATYSDEFFFELTGTDLPTLWNDYQTTLTP